MHHDGKSLSDRVARGMVKLARGLFDLASGYKHVTIPPNEKMTVAELRKGGYLLDDRAWLNVS